MVSPSGRAASGAEDHRQVVDGLYGCVRVVDRGGQRLAGHVAELPDFERRVLFHGAFETDPDRAIHQVLQGRWVGAGVVGGWGAGPTQHGARDDMFADPQPQPHGQPVLPGKGQDRVRVDHLQVPDRLACKVTAPPGACAGAFLSGLELGKRGQGVLLHPGHDGVDLDGMGEVVGEVHDIAMLAKSRTIAPLIASRGNCSIRPPAARPTVYSPAAEHTNVATKTLSTIWFARSRRNLRSSRDENWVEDNCSATTVRPRTRAITVTTVPAMMVSRLRASSAVPWKASGARAESSATLIGETANPTSRAATAPGHDRPTRP